MPGPTLPQSCWPKPTPTAQANLTALCLGSSYHFQWDNLRLREVAGSSLRLHSPRKWNQGKGPGQAASLSGQDRDRGLSVGSRKNKLHQTWGQRSAELIQAGMSGESRDSPSPGGEIEGRGGPRQGWGGCRASPGRWGEGGSCDSLFLTFHFESDRCSWGSGQSLEPQSAWNGVSQCP